jgi:hypothetical protein
MAVIVAQAQIERESSLVDRLDDRERGMCGGPLGARGIEG